MADRRGSSNCADHLTVGWLGRESSRYPKESGSIFKGTIPFSRAGVSSIRVYAVTRVVSFSYYEGWRLRKKKILWACKVRLGSGPRVDPAKLLPEFHEATLPIPVS